MMQILLASVFRTIIAFLLMVVVLRIIGRRVVSQLTLTDMGVGVTLGTIAADLAIGENRQPLAVGTAMVTMGLLAYATGYLKLKSLILRKLLESSPVPVVENGKLNEKNMARTHLTVDKLMAQLRDRDIFNLADVEFALFEVDGEITVQPKSQKRPVTPSDLGIPTQYTGLTADLIIDGRILHDSLLSINLDEKWLADQLHARGVGSARDVFYAGLDSQGGLYVSSKAK